MLKESPPAPPERDCSWEGAQGLFKQPYIYFCEPLPAYLVHGVSLASADSALRPHGLLATMLIRHGPDRKQLRRGTVALPRSLLNNTRGCT